MPSRKWRDFRGKHLLMLCFVAAVLLATFLIDRAYSPTSELFDFLYVVPLAAAALLLSPLETFGVVMLSILLELGTESISFQKEPEDIWSAFAVAGIGLLAVGFSYYGRRYIRAIQTAREDLKQSPIAYATFRFPGYRLAGYNQAYEQMLPAGRNRSKNLLKALSKDSSRMLAELMDRAVNNKTVEAKTEFPVLIDEGRRAYWDIYLIPAASPGKARPRSISLFAVEVTDAVLRNRTRDAALRVSTAIMSSLDLDETIHAALESLCQVAQTNAGGLFLIEDDQWVGMAGWGGYTDDMARQLRWPYDDLPTGVEAIASRHALAIEDAAADPRFSTERVRAFNIRSSLVVPLISGSRPIGACWLNQTDELRRFTAEQVEFATVIGTQAALAIENATIYENERAMRKSLEAIEAVSEVGLTSLDLDRVLNQLVERAQDVMQMDAAAIFLLDEEGRHLEARAVTGGTPEDVCAARARIESGGLIARTYRQGEPVKVDNLTEAEEDFCPMGCQKADLCVFSDCNGIRSALAVPLKLDGRVAGVMQVGSRSPAAFSAQEWSLIQMLSERASMAVQNSVQHAKIQGQLTRAALLKDVAEACAGYSDMSRIAESALEAVFERLGCHTASIYFLDKERGILDNLAFSGHPAGLIDEFRQLPLDANTFIPQAARSQQMIIHDNAEIKDIPEQVQRLLDELPGDVGRRIYLPIIYKGETVGAMAMLFPELRPFEPSEIDALKSIANQLALAIQHARLSSAGEERSGTSGAASV